MNFFKTIVFLLFVVIFNTKWSFFKKLKTIHPYLQTTTVVSYKQLLYLTNKTCCILQTTPVVSYKQHLLYLTNNFCILQTKPVVSHKQNLLYLTNNICCILQTKSVVSYKKKLSMWWRYEFLTLFQMKWVFVTNSDLLIPISQQPNVIDLRNFKV